MGFVNPLKWLYSPKYRQQKNDEAYAQGKKYTGPLAFIPNLFSGDQRKNTSGNRTKSIHDDYDRGRDPSRNYRKKPPYSSDFTQNAPNPPENDFMDRTTGESQNNLNQYSRDMALWQMEKQWELSQKAYAQQLMDQKQAWNDSNAYNSPKAQMARYREAGLNPWLMYGQGNPGNTTMIKSPGMNIPSASTPSADRPPNPVSQILDPVLQAGTFALDVYATHGKATQAYATAKNLYQAVIQSQAQTDLVRQNLANTQVEKQNLVLKGYALQKENALMDKKLRTFEKTLGADIGLKRSQALMQRQAALNAIKERSYIGLNKDAQTIKNIAGSVLSKKNQARAKTALNNAINFPFDASDWIHNKYRKFKKWFTR